MTQHVATGEAKSGIYGSEKIEIVIGETLRFEGFVNVKNLGDEGDTEVIYLSDDAETPLLERLEGLRGKRANVRYWTADVQAGADEIKEEFIKRAIGGIDVKFGPEYSEMTGYLWTDNDFNVGGHDLEAEISSRVGRWLVLEIEIEDAAATRQLNISRSFVALADKLKQIAADKQYIPKDMKLEIKFIGPRGDCKVKFESNKDGKMTGYGEGHLPENIWIRN